MKRNSTTLFLESPNATTSIPWINNQPDFSIFTEPTLGVLQKSWQNFLSSGEELEFIPDPEPVIAPLVANWDMFNLSMMSDARFNQVYNQCLGVAPIIANSLPTALDQITSKNSMSLFSLVWIQLCEIGEATSEDRLNWGAIAEANNLPQDFIDILKG